MAAGNYAENVDVNKPLTILGAQAGQDANARFAAFTTTLASNGPKADASTESIVTAPSVDPEGDTGPPFDDLFRVTADNVTIDGFTIDGNNPALDQTNAVQIGGVNVDARRAVINVDDSNNFIPVNNLHVVNDVIQSLSARAGHQVVGDDTTPTHGDSIQGNVIRSFGELGVILFDGAYADVENNTINAPDDTDALQMQNFPNTGSSMTWSGNTITVGQDATGIVANLFYATGGVLNITGNTINAASGVTASDASGLTIGIYVISVQVSSTVELSGNTIGNLGGGGDLTRHRLLERGHDSWPERERRHYRQFASGDRTR